MAGLGETTAENEAEKAKIQGEIDELQKFTQIGRSSCEKQGFELIELEESIIKEGGCWLVLHKVPAQEASADDKAAAGGKKAPAKGKGPSADDLKPIFGKAWVDLSDLMKPGATYMSKRVFLETIAPAVKEAGEKGDQWVDQQEFE